MLHVSTGPSSNPAGALIFSAPIAVPPAHTRSAIDATAKAILPGSSHLRHAKIAIALTQAIRNTQKTAWKRVPDASGADENSTCFLHNFGVGIFWQVLRSRQSISEELFRDSARRKGETMRAHPILVTAVAALIFALAPPGTARAETTAAPTTEEIDRVVSLADAMFAAENEILLGGEAAVESPPTWAVAMGQSGLATYSSRIEKALALHHSVVDEGLVIKASTTKLDEMTVTREPSGEFKGTATVTIVQTYVDPATDETSEASWTDDFELLLEPNAASSVLSVNAVNRLMPAENVVVDEDGVPDTSDYDPEGVVSSDDRSMAEDVPEIGTLALPRSYNVTNFVNYAIKWTKPGTGMNPDYPSFSNNCANFVSQSLNKAGWSRTGGVNPKDLGNWDDNLTGPSGASYTWAGAKYLYRYASDTKHLAHMSNVWNATPSDLLFVDWDRDGDKVIDHVAVVTGRTSGGVPRISQRTTRRHNILFTTWRQIITDSTGPDPIWYGRLNRKAS